MNNPLVSISCITYNHAPYIRQCLDGFLMQQCDFEYEILIHDDASTDGTSDIIREYQKKYPEIIKPIIQKENQWSQGVRGINIKFNFSRAKGKYIALCEGDDYWTDPLKLQKQVSFLEANPEYSLVCGGFKSVNAITGEEEIIIKDVEKSLDNTFQGFDITIERFFKQWITKTMTLVFRKEFYNPTDFENYKYNRDVHLNYHLLKRGKGYYMKEVLGVYHIHDGGVFSSLQDNSKLNTFYLVYKDLLKQNNNDKYLKNKVKNYLKKNIAKKAYENNLKMNKNSMNIELLSYSNSLNEFISYFKLVIKTYI